MWITIKHICGLRYTFLTAEEAGYPRNAGYARYPYTYLKTNKTNYSMQSQKAIFKFVQRKQIMQPKSFRLPPLKQQIWDF